MLKTFKELNKFSNTVSNMLRRNPKLIDTKFGYAIKRFEEKNLTSLYSQYNSELTNVRIDHALVDKATGALLKDPEQSKNGNSRGFLYDKAGLKACIAAEEAVEKSWRDREFEVEPYICKSENLPTGLTEEEMETFSGLVME